MQFELSEEQMLIRRTARDFARRTLAPGAAERDRLSEFPGPELRELAGLGLLGVAVPDRLGGAEAGAVAYALAMQELAYCDASVAAIVSVTNMVAELISRVGTEAQQRTHVPRVTGGEYECASFALSEPQAGSDPAAMATRAERTASGWRLTGTKQWVTSGDRAGLIVVWAVTDAKAGHRGISAFLVPGKSEGLHVNRAEDKMGLRGSTTVQLNFDGVELADDALLGELDQGFKLALIALDGGRIGIASQAVGIARSALDAAIKYALEREQFGRAIINHQAVGNMLADCATWLDAAELLCLRAARLKEIGARFSKEASMAKLFASEHAVKLCDIALQVHGGYGYTRDFPVERAYRDVRVTKIYEGTSEIQRIVIARNLIKEASGE
ncbi:MAG: acyl-CoA dehydrogenase family protein [Proteobacteria bacterium]|nr:acyl-CoA dehydrogenase family protein [Pseudomonadota bacterium]